MQAKSKTNWARCRVAPSGKPKNPVFCGASGRIHFRGTLPSRRHSSVRLHSGDSLGTGAASPRPWHAPKKLCFGGKPRAKRSARRGRKAPRSCAPNAMPPFAPPCGHFASLVRSIAPQSARVPSETLRVSAAHLASLKSASLPPLPAHFRRGKRASSERVSARDFAPETESVAARFIAAVQEAIRMPSSAGSPLRNE